MSKYQVYATQGQGEVLVCERDTFEDAEMFLEEHIGEASFAIRETVEHEPYEETK